jgi:hypothetical protein
LIRGIYVAKKGHALHIFWDTGAGNGQKPYGFEIFFGKRQIKYYLVLAPISQKKNPMAGLDIGIGAFGRLRAAKVFGHHGNRIAGDF